MKGNKNFKGKAIYNPSGKAGEYSYWACNFYVGCSNGCEYCYCKKGALGKAMGGNIPTLKKCFKSEEHALEVFEKEIKQNLSDLQENGLFFSLTTDPMLLETKRTTICAIIIAATYGVPCKILTKKTDYLFEIMSNAILSNVKNKIAIGFTLTGHDELEPNASTNGERIESMKKFHDAGFKTWTSIEPVITFPASLEMIEKTVDCCDLYKIGLMSGMTLDEDLIRTFVGSVITATESMGCKVYFKDELIRQAKIVRKHLPKSCVGRNYNIFK